MIGTTTAAAAAAAAAAATVTVVVVVVVVVGCVSSRFRTGVVDVVVVAVRIDVITHC
jgi:hypothetical protein